MADLVILWNKNTVCIECRISGEILYATALYVLEVTQVKISCHGWMTYDNTATGDQSRILAPALPFFGEPPWFVAPTDWVLYRPWTKKVSNISLVNDVERQAQEFAEWGTREELQRKRLLHPKSKRWGIHAVIAHYILFWLMNTQSEVLIETFKERTLLEPKLRRWGILFFLLRVTALNFSCYSRLFGNLLKRHSGWV